MKRKEIIFSPRVAIFRSPARKNKQMENKESQMTNEQTNQITFKQNQMKYDQNIHQARPRKPAGILPRRLLTGLIGLLTVAIFIAGALAQDAGAFRKDLSTKLQPGDIVYVDSGDAVHGGFVIKVNPLTGEKTVIASGGLLRMPFGVVIDAAGQLIVSDSERLIRINPETGAQSLIADNSHGDLGWPCGLAMEHNESIVVANLHTVVRVNLNSSHIQTVCAGGSLLYPLCVAVADNGDLIVLNMAFPAEILRVSPNGAQTIIARGSLLNHPQAIAVQGDHIFVTDVVGSDGNFGIGRVIDVDARTGEQSVLAEGDYLCGPVGITVDEDGQLVVGDPYTINVESPDLFDGGIIRINPVTHDQILVTRGEGAFVNPRGVAIVPNFNN